MDTTTPKRKKLVYGRQATLDKYIARYKAKGWRLRMSQVDYWKNGKKVYIAELEKEKWTNIPKYQTAISLTW